MTKIQNLQALTRSGQARRDVPMTLKELYESVAVYFDQRADQYFKSPLQIEDMPPADLEAMSTDGHIFGEVEKALNAAGVPTDGTMGSVMGALSMDQENDAHYFACNCHSPTLSGADAASRLRGIAKSK